MLHMLYVMLITANCQLTNYYITSISSSFFFNYIVISVRLFRAQIVKHLPNSPNIICGTIDRDCHRERAYLFIQNCNSTWINTKLSAGREYCCKAGTSMPCPLTL